MEFLAILLAWAAVQFWGSGGRIQQDEWLWHFHRLLAKVPSAGLRLALTVLLPVLGLALVYGLMDDMLFGLPAFLLSVAALLYSLGRGDFQILLRLYLNSWQRGDLEGAFRHAQTFSCELGEMDASNAAELHQNVRRALLYQGFERWFAVVFWFVLAGPAGALAYRLVFLMLRQSDASQAERDHAAQVLFYMEWLPVRLLALAFALIGDFDRCFTALKRHFSDTVASPELLDAVGQAALPAGLPEGQVDGEQFVDAAARQLEGLQHLLSRSLLCWVLVIAVVQLI